MRLDIPADRAASRRDERQLRNIETIVRVGGHAGDDAHAQRRHRVLDDSAGKPFRSVTVGIRADQEQAFVGVDRHDIGPTNVNRRAGRIHAHA